MKYSEKNWLPSHRTTSLHKKSTKENIYELLLTRQGEPGKAGECYEEDNSWRHDGLCRCTSELTRLKVLLS